MERLQDLAREALTWPFLEDEQRLVWAAVLEFDAVPTQALPPWFFERHNFTRRRLGVDLFGLDGQQALLCRAGNSTGRDVKRFLRTANCLFEAPCCTLWTDRGCDVSADSQRWLKEYGGQRKILTKKRLGQLCCDAAAASVLTSGQALAEELSDPPLRPCQEACLEACANGARVIEMACGTGKTRVIRELTTKQTGKVLVTVPSRVLLEQFAEEMPGFCKVGTGYNDKIDFSCRGFISVTDSVQLLKNLTFEACCVDEGHHPLPQGMPSCKDLFKFSATHKGDVDFRYSLGEAIEQGVLSDYDLTVPVTTEGHPYLCLANLLLSQAGRFRRVLAYCNSISEAKRFRQVLEVVGLAAWHINATTRRTERDRVMGEFSDDLQKPVHVLVTVQVLGEGVNIRNADTCMFVEPRSSYVSIIQAIGRVLRPHPTKPLAHIVLPAIALPATNRAAMPPPGLSHPAGSAQSIARTAGSVQHVQFPESDGIQLDPGSVDAPRVGAAVGAIARNGSKNSRGRQRTDQASETSRFAGSDEAGLQTHPARPASVTPPATASQQEPLLVQLPVASATALEAAPGTKPADVVPRQHGAGAKASMESEENIRSWTHRRASKLKVKRGDGAGLFGSEHADQLDRFLEAIAQADSRFADKDIRVLQSRLWVTDCRLQQPAMQQLLARDVLYQLALVLQQRDAFDLRLQAVEKFDQIDGRLPKQQAKQLEERTLGQWLHNVGYSQKQQMLSAERMHKLLNSSSSRLRARAAQWLAPSNFVKAWLEELQHFVREHDRMPDNRKGRSKAERRLIRSLLDIVNPANRNYERRLQLLEKVGPIVSDWVKSRRIRKLRVQKPQWSRQFDSLLDFVEVHARLPQARLEGALYSWLCKQRRQLDRLPAELQAKLRDGHPVIAAFLQS
ncbi:unnamed protein product [Symbiodinium microadriaticum]|nr:unnamed protein product [Symbiodinium microadriaticum]